MKKIFFVAALLCASMMSFAIDWSAYEWLGDGAGGGKYNEMYKVAPADNQEVINIQQFGGATEPGIYTRVPAALKTTGGCSLPEGKYMLDGSGILLYLSAFVAEETEVTLTDMNGTEYKCTVYYKGTETGMESIQSSDLRSQKLIENGQVIIMKNGVKYNALGTQVK